MHPHQFSWICTVTSPWANSGVNNSFTAIRFGFVLHQSDSFSLMNTVVKPLLFTDEFYLYLFETKRNVAYGLFLK